MGIPKQVIEAAEQADKELEAVAHAPIPEAEPSAQPTAEPKEEANAAPPNATVEPAAPKEEAKAEVPNANANGAGILSNVGANRSDEKLEKLREESARGRLEALQGQRKADLMKWEREKEGLVSKIAELESQLEEWKAKADQNGGRGEVAEGLGDGIDDEDARRFAKAVDARVEMKISKLRERLDANDAEKIERLKAEERKRAEDFIAKLEKDFPGFKKLDDSNDARWTGFLASSLGGVMEGTTYGEVAKAALERLDYRKFSSVVREFANQSGIVFSAGGKPEQASGLAGIRPRQINSAPTSGNKPKFFSAADIGQFRRAAFAGKAERVYGLTGEQVAERLRLYEDAEAEGRVI